MSTEFVKQLKTSKSDEYYTPAYAVDIIVPYLRQRGFRTIWCPFDEEHSEFVNVLRKNGFGVVFGHIDTGQDFFDYESPPTKADCIVSNPPFSQRDAVFSRLYEFGLPFAMIMNFNGLFDSKVRYGLFKYNNFELLIPRGRIKFYDENMEYKTSQNFQSVYVCNRVLDRQIEFCDMKMF